MEEYFNISNSGAVPLWVCLRRFGAEGALGTTFSNGNFPLVVVPTFIHSADTPVYNYSYKK